MIRLKKHLAICVCLLAAVSAWASTTNQRLLIDDVTRDGDGWVLTVRALWGMKTPMDSSATMKLRWNLNVFLDGKKATPEEAFRPGHTIRHQGDSGYYECYSSDFRFPAVEGQGKHDGVYLLTLENAGHARATEKGQGKNRGKTMVRAIRYDLYVHAEVRGGTIVGAGASGLFTKNNAIRSLPVDAAGLSLTGDRLQGSVVVTLLSYRGRMPRDGVGRLPVAYEIDVTLGKDAITGFYATKATGRQTGGPISVSAGVADGTEPVPPADCDKPSAGQKTVKGAIRGERSEPVPARGRDCTVWFGYQAPLGLDDPGSVGWAPGRNMGDITLRLKDGALADGLMSGCKGYAFGLVTASTLKVDGNRIEGEITYATRGVESKIRISGILVGHQIFGECETNGHTGRIRGGIRVFDCPPFMGWKGKTVGRWLKEHPKEPVPPKLVMPEKK